MTNLVGERIESDAQQLPVRENTSPINLVIIIFLYIGISDFSKCLCEHKTQILSTLLGHRRSRRILIINLILGKCQTTSSILTMNEPPKWSTSDAKRELARMIQDPKSKLHTTMTFDKLYKMDCFSAYKRDNFRRNAD